MPDASERKVLIICLFVAGCITLGPMQWVSAAILIVSSGVLALLNLQVSKREETLVKLLEEWAPGPPAKVDSPAAPPEPAIGAALDA